MAHTCIFSLSLQGTRLGDADGEDLCREITPFGTWVLSLCNGSGEAGLREGRGRGQKQRFLLFIYLTRVGSDSSALPPGRVSTRTGWEEEDENLF